MTIKEKLIELIEAYAVAKSTANSVLIGLSASAVKTMIDDLQFSEVSQKDPEVSNG